jgi:hypothetical protein
VSWTSELIIRLPGSDSGFLSDPRRELPGFGPLQIQAIPATCEILRHAFGSRNDTDAAFFNKPFGDSVPTLIVPGSGRVPRRRSDRKCQGGDEDHIRTADVRFPFPEALPYPAIMLWQFGDSQFVPTRQLAALDPTSTDPAAKCFVSSAG